MTGIYFIASAIVYFFLGMVWSKSDFANAMLKALLFILSLFAVYFALTHYGVIITTKIN